MLSIIQEDNREAGESTSELGSRGETLALSYLAENGYRIVMSNFKVPVGRNSKGVQITGEIDVVALDGETLCFVEVKTRRSDDFAPVIAAVDARKQRQITRTAKIYRKLFDVLDVPHRYDVVTVLVKSPSKVTIELTRGFWSEAKFRKRQWIDESWL